MESDIRMWIRSESENSVPSWASSISLDSQSEEAILDFMRRFVNILFHDSSSITLELKSEFGQYARSESGRLWFSRLVNAQRVKAKRVDETTFYSLVQYFAIVLFECAESDDFSPAKSLMNMCFTFYHDSEYHEMVENELNCFVFLWNFEICEKQILEDWTSLLKK